MLLLFNLLKALKTSILHISGYDSSSYNEETINKKNITTSKIKE